MTRLNEVSARSKLSPKIVFKIFIPYVKITFGKKSKKTSKTTVATPQR